MGNTHLCIYIKFFLVSDLKKELRALLQKLMRKPENIILPITHHPLEHSDSSKIDLTNGTMLVSFLLMMS